MRVALGFVCILEVADPKPSHRMNIECEEGFDQPLSISCEEYSRSLSNWRASRAVQEVHSVPEKFREQIGCKLNCLTATPSWQEGRRSDLEPSRAASTRVGGS
jgi:hypothetical protein